MIPNQCGIPDGVSTTSPGRRSNRLARLQRRAQMRPGCRTRRPRYLYHIEDSAHRSLGTHSRFVQIFPAPRFEVPGAWIRCPQQIHPRNALPPSRIATTFWHEPFLDYRTGATRWPMGKPRGSGWTACNTYWQGVHGRRSTPARHVRLADGL